MANKFQMLFSKAVNVYDIISILLMTKLRFSKHR